MTHKDGETELHIDTERSLPEELGALKELYETLDNVVDARDAVKVYESINYATQHAVKFLANSKNTEARLGLITELANTQVILSQYGPTFTQMALDIFEYLDVPVGTVLSAALPQSQIRRITLLTDIGKHAEEKSQILQVRIQEAYSRGTRHDIHRRLGNAAA